MPPNFRTLDLNLLRVVDATMAEGSLTRAAATLAMTQPAVSHALKRLRGHLGEELFERMAHGVRPTPRAQALWPAVRDALAAMRQGLAPGDFDPAHDEVQFHLAMADSTAWLLAPPLVQAIEAGGARANLRVLPLTTRDPTALLDSGEADLAVGVFPALITRLVGEG
ncbi:MAG: LysR family transcriptional regulator, partial [Betaproteobacteria bacterium]